jgi:integrase
MPRALAKGWNYKTTITQAGRGFQHFIFGLAILCDVQRGTIYKKHGAWYVVYRIEGKQKTHRLAAVDDDHRSKKEVEQLAQDHLRPLNVGSISSEGLMTVSDFARKYFLPGIEKKIAEKKRKPSLLKFYRDTINNHIEPVLGSLQLREVTTKKIQHLLDSRSGLSQTSVIRLKAGVGFLLGDAIRQDFLAGANPAREAKPEGRRSEFEGYAYSLAEEMWMIEHLPEPSSTVVAVAAFSGLRESEIRGLRWTDYDGKFFNVRTSIWRTHEGEPKTRKSKNAVPVIEPLQKILAAHRKVNGSSEWIFAGVKRGRPLHLDNLCRREMKPILGERWHGWHAFRRGITTVLFGLDVPAETAQLILRHEDVATTQAHYLMLKSKKEGSAAMKKLGRVVRRMLDKQAKISRSKPHKH